VRCNGGAVRRRAQLSNGVAGPSIAMRGNGDVMR